MSDVGCPGNQDSLNEHGHRNDGVIQVSDTPVERIVRQEDVTRPDHSRIGIQFQYRLHCFVKDTYERRDTCPGSCQVAVSVGDGGTHVEYFVDDGAHCSFAHHCEHLVTYCLQGALNYLQAERVMVSMGHAQSLACRPYISAACASVRKPSFTSARMFSRLRFLGFP